jgi:hypothetical protein
MVAWTVPRMRSEERLQELLGHEQRHETGAHEGCPLKRAQRGPREQERSDAWCAGRRTQPAPSRGRTARWRGAARGKKSDGAAAAVARAGAGSAEAGFSAAQHAAVRVDRKTATLEERSRHAGHGVSSPASLVGPEVRLGRADGRAAGQCSGSSGRQQRRVETRRRAHEVGAGGAGRAGGASRARGAACGGVGGRRGRASRAAGGVNNAAASSSRRQQQRRAALGGRADECGKWSSAGRQRSHSTPPAAAAGGKRDAGPQEAAAASQPPLMPPSFLHQPRRCMLRSRDPPSALETLLLLLRPPGCSRPAMWRSRRCRCHLRVLPRGGRRRSPRLFFSAPHPGLERAAVRECVRRDIRLRPAAMNHSVQEVHRSPAARRREVQHAAGCSPVPHARRRRSEGRRRRRQVQAAAAGAAADHFSAQRQPAWRCTARRRPRTACCRLLSAPASGQHAASSAAAPATTPRREGPALRQRLPLLLRLAAAAAGCGDATLRCCRLLRCRTSPARRTPSSAPGCSARGRGCGCPSLPPASAVLLLRCRIVTAVVTPPLVVPCMPLLHACQRRRAKKWASLLVDARPPQRLCIGSAPLEALWLPPETLPRRAARLPRACHARRAQPFRPRALRSARLRCDIGP